MDFISRVYSHRLPSTSVQRYYGQFILFHVRMVFVCSYPCSCTAISSSFKSCHRLDTPLSKAAFIYWLQIWLSSSPIIHREIGTVTPKGLIEDRIGREERNADFDSRTHTTTENQVLYKSPNLFGNLGHIYISDGSWYDDQLKDFTVAHIFTPLMLQMHKHYRWHYTLV